ncbi:transposase [Streptomyces brasiliensis]|uniref:transposase n=1 Tax=Streptomyces brasiliensis TaxID=1954 RepID=UPI0035714A37
MGRRGWSRCRCSRRGCQRSRLRPWLSLGGDPPRDIGDAGARSAGRGVRGRARTDCHACPVQDECTTSARGTRIRSLRPQELHQTLAGARTEQNTKTWKDKYTLRAGIEGTINQALDVTGLRRARYRALPKVRLQHAFSATALNVIRLDAHWKPGHTALSPRTSRRFRHQLGHRSAAPV